MAYVFMTNGTRTEIAPANGKTFTQDELGAIVGGPLDMYELPGNLYAAMLHKAKEIGADLNELAVAGHVIHMAHLEAEGVSQLLPAPEFYGTVVFCKPEELENGEPAVESLV